MKLVSEHSVAAGYDLKLVLDFIKSYRAVEPEGGAVADLTFGNPHEPPLPALVSALRTHIEPLAADWFAYKAERGRAVPGYCGRVAGRAWAELRAGRHCHDPWRLWCDYVGLFDPAGSG